MIAFSVPMTEASSRYTRAPRSALRGELVDAVELDSDAERGERVDVRVEAPAADHVAAGRRHGDAAEPGEQRARRGGTRRGSRARASGSRSVFDDAAWDRRARRSARSTRRPRRGRRGARPSSRRRGSAGRSRGAPRRRRGREAARIGSAPFLFPAARTVPLSGRPPSMTKDSMARECVLGACRLRTVSSSPAGARSRAREGIAAARGRGPEVERELGLEGADDVLGLAEPVALALEEQVRVRDPCARAARRR